MNIETFQKEFEPDAPSGTELKKLPEFLSLQNALSGASRAARTGPDGKINLSPGIAWHDILDSSETLAALGHDLRLLVIAVRAMTNVDRFGGLSRGLDMIAALLKSHWDSIHPQPREGASPDTTISRRANAIAELENRDNGLLGDLEMMVLLDPRGVEPILGQDLVLAGTKEYDYLQAAPSGLSADDLGKRKATHAAACQRVEFGRKASAETAAEALATLKSEIAGAEAARLRLQTAFAEASGDTNGGSLDLKALGAFLARLTAALSETKAETAGDQEMTSQGASNSGSTPAAPQSISSRRDVERSLDSIIAFYKNTEPSSPIPLLAERLRRMVNMDFMQLMDEIAPGGVNDVKKAAGVKDKKNRSSEE